MKHNFPNSKYLSGSSDVGKSWWKLW
jgi:hypothetical protein